MITHPPLLTGEGRADRTRRMSPLTAVAAAMLVTAPVMVATGVPRTPLMWPLYRFGIVLPGCGLTRGVVAIAGGNLARAWQFNPASFLVVAAATGLVVRFAVGSVTGEWPDLHVRWARWQVAGLFVATAALWANQQLHADLLINQLR